MKSISAISLAIIGTQAGQVNVHNLQDMDSYEFAFVEEPEHPEMELIVSDFGGAAPNLQHHHHKNKKSDKVELIQKPKYTKTVPIVA